jgi:tRNA1Val (adenine37-N6)-methyltransferase
VSDAELEARRLELELELGEPITVDGLTASYKIFQRKRGHRHSTDDLLTAWYALEHAPDALRAIDLGTGIGGVALLFESQLPPGASVVAIEAQPISYRFLVENIRANAARVEPIHGDLRELALAERFPLVTGSPPYFDPSAGIVPADSQKAHARFELRGDIGDYARAATRHLAPAGWFVLCFPYQQLERAIDALHREGFAIAHRRDVIPRIGLAPLFSLFACKRERVDEVVEPPFVVRDADGSHAIELHTTRRRFGWP